MHVPANALVATALIGTAVAVGSLAAAEPAERTVGLGPRPGYLVDALEDGPLKARLETCRSMSVKSTAFSIAHRGAPLQFPEHTAQSYRAAVRMGAGIVECDATFTKDRELVCRHSQCDLHATTNILVLPDLAAKCSQPFVAADPDSGTEASAKCCTSDLTLAEFKRLEGKMDAVNPAAKTVEVYMGGTPKWRTELYASNGTVMSHADYLSLLGGMGVKYIPELKAPAVPMPFDGGFTQADFVRKLVDAYRAAGIAPEDVYIQSFDLDDIRYLRDNAPEFAAQAVYLDGRDTDGGFDPNDPASWDPTMESLAREGVRIIAPAIWVLLTLDGSGRIVPSAYASAAKAAGLDIIAWSLERSGPLEAGGGWYYKSITEAIKGDGQMYEVLDVLARQVEVRGVFSDWPATVTYYANCMGLR